MMFMDRHLNHQISWSRMSMLNTEANPCSENNDVSMERCVDDHTKSKIGCTWNQEEDKGMRLCSTKEDLERFANVTLEVS